jgi:Single-strand binding protein family
MSKEHELDITALVRSELAVAPCDDIADGPGLHVAIGEGTAHVFPRARAARVELAGDRARITNLTCVTVEGDALSAAGETESYRSAFRLDGQGLDFTVTRKDGAVPSVAAVETDSEVIEPLEVEASDGEQGDASGPENGDRERVQLVGRIGYKPRFRETPNGTLVGQFALAAHAEPGQTTWHSVVTFGARAEKLRDCGLEKGDDVAVIGYPHERERRNPKTGETKTVTEIYAAVVKRPKDKE